MTVPEQPQFTLHIRNPEDGSAETDHRIDTEPCFPMSVVARLVHMHPQTIRHYERLGLVQPSRTSGNIRMFCQRDIRRLQQINTLTSLGVNLAGVEVIVRLLEQTEQMRSQLESEMHRLHQELDRLRSKGG